MVNFNANLSGTQKGFLKTLVGNSIAAWGLKLINGNTDFEFTRFSADKIMLEVDPEIYFKLEFVKKDTGIKDFAYYEPLLEQIDGTVFYSVREFCISPSYYNKIISVEVFREKKECTDAVAEFDSLIVLNTDDGVRYCFYPQLIDDNGGIEICIIKPEHYFESAYSMLIEVFDNKYLESLLSGKLEN